MAEKNPNESPEPKATPLEAVEPTEVPAVMGATFAERAKSSNKGSKQVASDDVEDKAVSSASTKSRARKK